MNEVTKERYVKLGLYVSVVLSIIILPIIIAWVTVNGIDAINWNFLTGKPSFILTEEKLRVHGIFPQIVGSLYLVSLSTLISAPLGLCSAIYLSEYAPDNILTRGVRFFIETLSGVPSIVIGLFGLEFLVYYLKLQFSLLAGAVSLSFMMLPWIIRASEEAIIVVPQEYREASLALGSTKWQTIYKVVLPAAVPGVLTGVLLGMGRAIGETAVVMLTTGSGLERFVPKSLRSPSGSLPMYIYLVATQATEQVLMNKSYGAAFVLLVLFLSMSVSALFVRNYYLRKLGHV